MFRERRKEIRIKGETKISFRVIGDDVDSSASKIFFAFTRDISVGGTRMITDIFLPLETILEIELPLLRLRKIIRVKGKVKWRRNLGIEDIFEMGLEFVNTQPESTLALMEYVYGSNPKGSYF